MTELTLIRVRAGSRYRPHVSDDENTYFAHVDDLGHALLVVPASDPRSTLPYSEWSQPARRPMQPFTGKADWIRRTPGIDPGTHYGWLISNVLTYVVVVEPEVESWTDASRAPLNTLLVSDRHFYYRPVGAKGGAYTYRLGTDGRGLVATRPDRHFTATLDHLRSLGWSTFDCKVGREGDDTPLRRWSDLVPDEPVTAPTESSEEEDAHHRDIRLISERFQQEAKRRNWCSEWDNIANELNEALSVPLVPRPVHQVEVTMTLTRTITVTGETNRHDAEVEARRRVEAEVARPWGWSRAVQARAER